ncbi:O-antigen ligase family protein [Pedobacter sp. GR22-6]|uniref:O-antigen ligase family protein n=1 Tax=Pedobacter sp. GR22-6 TaxID=3127957 RepID=UPI00307CE852
MKNKSSIFSSFEYLLLVACTPIIQVLEFILLKGWNPLTRPEKNFTPYMYIGVFLYIIFKTNYDKKQLFLLLIFGFGLIFYDSNTLANNASYLINIILTCSLLLAFAGDKSVAIIKKHDTYLVGLILFIIAFYYTFSVESLLEDRYYLVGFVIPHQLAYYCAIFTFYFLYTNRLQLAIVVSAAGAYVGARSGLLAMLVPYVYYFLRNMKDSKNRSRILGLGVVAILALPIFSIFSSSASFDRISSTFENTFSFGDKSQEEYSESRTIIWFNMFAQVEEDGFSSTNIVGRGPYASMDFNYKTFGLQIWMHNDLFDIMFNLGILGVILYVFCFWYYLKEKDVYALIFFLILIVTNGFFTYSPVAIILLHNLSNNLKLKQRLIDGFGSKATV